MTIILAAISLTLFFWQVFLPVLKYFELKRQRLSQLNYRCLQLKTVRAWYPELADLSYTEINQRYNVSEAYNDIGRIR